MGKELLYCRITQQSLDDQTLHEMIDVADDLLDELRRCRALDQSQIELVRGETTHSGKVRRLLHEVRRTSSDRHTQLLLSALNKTNRSHVTNYIRNAGQRPSADANWPIYECGQWFRMFSNWRELKELIDSRYGFLDELLSVGCITDEQKQHIMTETQDTARNELLLLIFQRKSVCEYRKFIDCLAKTKQNHVLSLLEPDWPQNAEPITVQQKRTLIANYAVLIELLDTNTKFLTSLNAADVITLRQKEHVVSALAKTVSEANTILLDILKRGSKQSFDMFIQCLIENEQRHVADVLLSNGVVAEMIAKSSLTPAQEDAIAEKFFDMYRNTSSHRRQQLLSKFNNITAELQETQLIAMKTQHSIKLLILCKSLSGLLYLNELHSTGQLGTIVQQLLIALSDGSQPVVLHSLVWNRSNYNECVQHLSNGYDLPVYSQLHELAQQLRDGVGLPTSSEPVSSSVPVIQLPHELLEGLLLKAAGQLYVANKKMTSRAHVLTLTALHTVCRYWWETLTDGRRNRALLKQYFSQGCSPYRFNPKLVTSLRLRHRKEGRLMGVAEFRERLYFVRYWSNIVETWSIVGSSYRDLGEAIKVAELRSPQDIVACCVTNCLYISDGETHCIWRLSSPSTSPTNEATAKKFIVTTYMPQKMSIQTGRLLVVADGGLALYVYNCEDGELIRKSDECASLYEVPLYMPALHAVETLDGTVIVCHGNRRVGDANPEHRTGVSEVHGDSRVLRRNEETAIELKVPCYLTIDNRKHVLVCDRFNKLIVHLNGELKLQQVAFTQTELSGQPYRLCFIETRRLLYVCYIELPSQVDVFSV